LTGGLLRRVGGEIACRPSANNRHKRRKLPERERGPEPLSNSALPQRARVAALF
jgi:hypothetical protein